MRRSYIFPTKWMVIYEYEVPGGAFFFFFFLFFFFFFLFFFFFFVWGRRKPA
jgi:hypothetical protein